MAKARKTKKKETRGGYRENAKRPLKYGEETVLLRFVVPKSKVDHINSLVRTELKQWEVKK